MHERVINSILEFIPSLGFTCMGLDYSPIKGPEGNIEYICHLKNAQLQGADVDVKAIVAASHEVL